MHFVLLASGRSGCDLMTVRELVDYHGMTVDEGGKKGMGERKRRKGREEKWTTDLLRIQRDLLIVITEWRGW